MSKVFVFCIGGTGIRVMKSITMLMASGMSTNGHTVVPVILDPHLDLKEKGDLHTLLESYKSIYNDSVSAGDGSKLNALPGFFNSEIQMLGDLVTTPIATQAQAADQSFDSYINKGGLAVNDINHHLIETLFSQKNLNNKLSVGFKGNPNVGTVVLGKMIEDADWFQSFKNICEDGDKIFIISSIFGGTGASGYPLLEKKIKGASDRPAIQQALMGAVTVLPYFSLSDPARSGSDIDSSNFYTKTKAALAYYQNTVKSDYLYYVGETSLKKEYVNNEKEQKDAAHFIEVVAASAFFDFLQKPRPDNRQYLTRAIKDDKDSMSLADLGEGYKDIVKSVADYMLLSHLIDILPQEKWFPLKKNRGFTKDFYKDSSFKKIVDFTKTYNNWYGELSTNARAFAPLRMDKEDMSSWIDGITLDAKDESYYLLEMVKASNACKKTGQNNKFRFFLQFAYEAIDFYTKKIWK
jgi:hypothetical protein